MGRLKPGATAAQVARQPRWRVSRRPRRRDSTRYLAGLTDSAAGARDQPEPDRGAAVARRAGRPRHLRRQPRPSCARHASSPASSRSCCSSSAPTSPISCCRAPQHGRRRSRCGCRWARRGGRLIGQLLVESLLLASIGGALGVAVGLLGQAAAAVAPPRRPHRSIGACSPS